MANIASINEDAQLEEEQEKYIIDNYLIHKSEALDLANEEQFVKLCNEVVKDYNLDNYINKIDIWDALPKEEKLEYCNELLFEIFEDEFPILRQVDVFQKLVNLDFTKFNYYRVLECAFFDKAYDGVNATTTINIPYNPLIPKKHYNEYIKRLYEKSGIGHLKIPLEKAANYLSDLLYIWFLHIHEKLTAYAIADSHYDLDQHKEISRKIKSIKKIIVPNSK